MGRREGTVDPRVTVVVSQAMAKLRGIQGVLNGFWQTSELAYGYFLSQANAAFANKEQRTFEVLGHIESEVWYPNNQGRIKRDDTIATTLEQVRQNTAHTYRATLLSFASAFEAYLDERVGPLNVDARSWGPYVRSLSIPPLTTSRVPIRLRTILCADLCRELRNMIVHESFAVPTAVSDSSVSEWRQRLQSAASKPGWPSDSVQAELRYAVQHVIGQAVNHMQDATRQGKQLPIELFYMLFNFTNLDSLAFEIEEALLPEGTQTGYHISRKEAAVRRRDLMVAHPTQRPAQLNSC